MVLTPGGKIVEVREHPRRPPRGRPVGGRLVDRRAGPPDDLPEVRAFAGVLQDHRMARRLRARLATEDDGWRWIECTLFAAPTPRGTRCWWAAR